MELIRATKERLQFQTTAQDKAVLFHLLQLYPLVPLTQHRLSKGSQIPNQTENQQLLEQSLIAQQTENQKQLVALLQNKARFQPTKQGFKLSLNRVEIEWLLQVLNDVRVGSWLALGSPDTEMAEEELSREPSLAPHVAAMHLAGTFQMYLLDALSTS
jgi:hypothetical protein